MHSARPHPGNDNSSSLRVGLITWFCHSLLFARCRDTKTFLLKRSLFLNSLFNSSNWSDLIFFRTWLIVVNVDRFSNSFLDCKNSIKSWCCCFKCCLSLLNSFRVVAHKGHVKLSLFLMSNGFTLFEVEFLKIKEKYSNWYKIHNNFLANC